MMMILMVMLRKMVSMISVISMISMISVLLFQTMVWASMRVIVVMLLCSSTQAGVTAIPEPGAA